MWEREFMWTTDDEEEGNGVICTLTLATKQIQVSKMVYKHPQKRPPKTHALPNL